MVFEAPHFIAFLDGPSLEAPASGDLGHGSEKSLARYARRYFESRPNSGLDIDAIKGIEEIRAARPHFVDREARLKALPLDVVDRLKAQERCLLSSIAREWHLPPEERYLNCWVEVLSQEFANCSSGTVAVVRQTDHAKIAYLLPHVRVDIETGAVLIEAPQSWESARFGAASVSRAAVPAAATATAGDDPANIALGAASTLAFALPEPWGVMVAAGLGLVDALLPKEKSHLTGDIVAALDTYMKQRDLNNWVQGANSLMKWCSEKIAQMRTVEPPVSEIKELLLPDLEKNLAPGGTSLYDNLIKIAGPDYIKEKGALDILLVCVSTYLFGLRFKLQLDAYVAHKAYVEDDLEVFNEWNQRRFDYVELKNAVLGDGAEVQGWATKVGPIIDAFISARLTKVTQPARREFDCTTCDPVSGCASHHHKGWAFSDTENGDGDWQYHFFEDTYEGKNTTEHKDKAEQARQQYVSTLSGTLDATYSTSKQTVRQWRDSINEWNDHLPPGKPKSGPKIDPNGWQGTASSDSSWAKYKHVSYAVQFYNDKGPNTKGPGLISEWSEATEINNRARPTLIDVPVDDLLMATGRRIYRKFDSEKQKLIDLMNDNATTTYVDQK